jgi:hypothetical protein
MAHMKKRAWKLSSAALAGEKKSLQFGAGRWCPNPWCMVFNTKGGCICIYIYIYIYMFSILYINIHMYMCMCFVVCINVCMYVYKVEYQSGISNNVSIIYVQSWRYMTNHFMRIWPLWGRNGNGGMYILYNWNQNTNNTMMSYTPDILLLERKQIW